MSGPLITAASLGSPDFTAAVAAESAVLGRLATRAGIRPTELAESQSDQQRAEAEGEGGPADGQVGGLALRGAAGETVVDVAASFRREGPVRATACARWITRSRIGLPYLLSPTCR